MNIAFITFGNRTTASTRYRVLQYIPLLKRDGFHCSIIFYNGRGSKISFVYKVLFLLQSFIVSLHTDVIVIQKFLFPVIIQKILFLFCKHIVFDIDDSIWLQEPTAILNPSQSQSLKRKFYHMIKISDIVIAGNVYLKRNVEKYSKNCIIIPTVVDAARYYLKKSYKKQNIKLGWIGIKENFTYLSLLDDVFTRLAKVYGKSISLSVISNGKFVTEHLMVHNIPWSEQAERTLLREIDIGLMPLNDTPWSRGKCAFKALQFMASGVPTIVSPVGVNRDIIEEGVTGFFASEPKEWEEKINILSKNDELRKKMGENARSMVTNNYSLKRMYPKVKNVFQQIENKLE